MNEQALSQISVGIVSDDEQQLRIIHKALELIGVQIRLTSKPSSLKESVMIPDTIQLWIVELVCQESWGEFIDGFIPKATVPLFFGDGKAPPIESAQFLRWQRRLTEKIEKLFSPKDVAYNDVNINQGLNLDQVLCIDQQGTSEFIKEADQGALVQGSASEPCLPSKPAPISDLKFYKPPIDEFSSHSPIQLDSKPLKIPSSSKPLSFQLMNVNADYAERVWVLGASLGGPSAVKEFLDSLDPKLPIAFVIVQHIDKGFQALLGQVLTRDNHFEVIQDFTRIRLRQGQVLIVPTDSSIMIDSSGFFVKTNHPWEDIYHPSISEVMKVTCEHYLDLSGAIIFSGMGNDSSLAAESFCKFGGKIWAQSEESCINSAQPDAIRKTGRVSYNGSPYELAQELMQTLG